MRWLDDSFRFAKFQYTETAVNNAVGTSQMEARRRQTRSKNEARSSLPFQAKNASARIASRLALNVRTYHLFCGIKDRSSDSVRISCFESFPEQPPNDIPQTARPCVHSSLWASVLSPAATLEYATAKMENIPIQKAGPMRI